MKEGRSGECPRSVILLGPDRRRERGYHKSKANLEGRPRDPTHEKEGEQSPGRFPGTLPIWGDDDDWASFRVAKGSEFIDNKTEVDLRSVKKKSFP